jgi:AcrR family transcriptional regulator
MIHVTQPTTQRGQTTRAHIVDTAYQICAEEGIRALRTRTVAVRAQVNVSTLHYYFPTKHDLLLAVLDGLLTRFREKAPHVATLSQELNAAVASATQNPAMLAVWYDFWNLSRTDDAVNEMLRTHLEGWRRRLADLIQETQSSANATALLALALGLPIVAFTLPQWWTVDTLESSVEKWIGTEG